MSDGALTLETRDLTVGHGRVPVLSSLHLEVGRGEIVAILGRNGAGKTTLLHTIAGALPPLAGEILFGGRSAQGAVFARARRGIALLPENRGIVRRLSVAENLRLGGGNADVAYRLFPELSKLSRRKAGLLSGGEQQMLGIGRSIASAPRLLLVDELSLGLAPVIVARLSETLRKVADTTGCSILMVEQYLHAALAVSDRAYVVGNGQIQLSGRSSDLTQRIPEIEAFYLAEPSTVATGAMPTAGIQS